MKRNCTREEAVRRVDGGGSNDAVSVEWDEDFHSVCSFSGYKDNVFHPWEIGFAVLQVGEVSCFDLFLVQISSNSLDFSCLFY